MTWSAKLQKPAERPRGDARGDDRLFTQMGRALVRPGCRRRLSVVGSLVPHVPLIVLDVISQDRAILVFERLLAVVFSLVGDVTDQVG